MIQKNYHFMISGCVSDIFLYLYLLLKPKLKESQIIRAILRCKDGKLYFWMVNKRNP